MFTGWVGLNLTKPNTQTNQFSLVRFGWPTRIFNTKTEPTSSWTGWTGFADHAEETHFNSRKKCNSMNTLVKLEHLKQHKIPTLKLNKSEQNNPQPRQHFLIFLGYVWKLGFGGIVYFLNIIWNFEKIGKNDVIDCYII